MADNTFSITVLLDGEQSVPYGSTLNLAGSAYPTSFSPTSGISAVNVASLTVSGSNTIPSFNLSAAAVFPTTFTWDGASVTPTTIRFNVCADNTALHADDLYTNVIVTASAYGLALSAGAEGTMTSGTWVSTVDQVTALGDAGAPSGVSGFTGTFGKGSVVLTWTNGAESDLSAVRIMRSDSSVPADYTTGTYITTVASTVSTYTDTVDGGYWYYAAFTQDNVEEWSTLVPGTTAANYVTSTLPGAVAGETTQEARSRKEVLGHN